MFLVGVVWFAVASLACALAPTVGLLVAARALQGVGGALLTPGSLAIIQSTFAGEDRGRAIGAWSGLGGIAGAVAPFLGGWIVEVTTWRWVFGINLPLAAVQTLEDISAHSMVQTAFAMVMLAIAASVALLLGVVGIYGVIAFIAAQRTREIGIRMALGARIADVRLMFLRYGLRLTAAGIVLGVTVALALTRVLSALLFGVGPMDPLTYLAVSGALAVIALLATYLPARRAARVDPIVALRADG